MKHTMNRRNFLTAASAGSLLVLPSARQAFAAEANERLRLAVFGAMYNAQSIVTGLHSFNAEVVALCNPDAKKIAEVKKLWTEQATKLAAASDTAQQRAAAQYRRMAAGEGVKVYADVRQMFGEMAERIDAFVLSDYDHFHGVACGAAMRAGKPVCSERPLGFTIADARGLRALAAEKKLVTTYRSPGTGMGPFRRAMELVQDGVIGPVKEVHIWFKRGGPDRDALPQGAKPVPDGLNWDLWLGPLAWREYNPEWMSYGHWRETCNGGLGVFGMHTTIFPFMVLGLRELWDTKDAKIQVRAECARLNRVSFPKWERVRWEIPARKDMPACTFTWHHGPDFAPGTRELIHEKLSKFGVTKAEEADALMATAGSLIIGADGAIMGNDHSTIVTCLPKEKFAKLETKRPQRLGDTQGIYKDWFDACRGGKREIIANFDNGGRLSELVMTGNIATLFPGETLTYEPAAGQFVNHAEANQRLVYKYRDGWKM